MAAAAENCNKFDKCLNYWHVKVNAKIFVQNIFLPC